MIRRFLVPAILLLVFIGRVVAQNDAAASRSVADHWLAENFPGKGAASAAPPFSFVYDGKPFSEWVKTWKVRREVTRIDENRARQTLTYTDPLTHLEVRCVMIAYHDFPTVEWTVYLKYNGTGDSLIVENLKGLDMPLADQKLVHAANGGHASLTDYQPIPFGPADITKNQNFNPATGRGSDQTLPYFDVEYGTGSGLIVAVGWPGQWQANFDGARATAGQQLVHTVLHEGEEIRSPLIALQFWQGGDWIDAQNVWRRWMIAHNNPNDHGKPLAPLINTCCDVGTLNTADNLRYLNAVLKAGIKPDYWWMDAGWYGPGGEWVNTGTWEVDAKRFPKGIREISNQLHTDGVKALMWFEPERVTPGSWLYTQHPDWLLSQPGKDWKILDLGNPDAWAWALDHFDGLIVSQGIDLYRQDFNIEPLQYWRTADAPDRQGMTENKYVVGYLAYWDELRRRHPGMLIDSCASGGRRNDLESMRRAVAMTRSDDCDKALDQQGQTYGFSFWQPYEGIGLNEAHDMEPYTFRSCLSWSITPVVSSWDITKDLTSQRKEIEIWRKLNAYVLGDYYPLTSYNLSDSDWMAWQYNRPDKGDGLIQVFRHPKVESSIISFRLRGLQAHATYTVTNIDTEESKQLTGAAMMTSTGAPFEVKDKPGAGLYTYTRTSP